LYREVIFETLMSDDFSVLGEGIKFSLIMIHLGSSHSGLKTPIPVKSYHNFRNAGLWGIVVSFQHGQNTFSSL
jgi:hypothetical protein